ncbi:STAS/SEC14 domain-containing protein [Pedobacter sp. SYSU D00535]|uniref:STAS/SEC14 domain-containing protein n=1 Tax=Pedobacter sp. SYSU D00535 TaxID=2810308 RepID=UPI001A9707F5|nr:STAS/SEC14 domain-containing protein [Pedobacter sp. SYSU D00535]
MVELLTDFPPHVAAYKASGAVSKEEYRALVMSRVDEVAAEFGHINFLVYLETDMDNYSLAAFFDYLKISFKHFSKWNRMAIVTNETWLRKAYDLLSPLVHGEIRTYRLQDIDVAREWVSAPLN